MEKEEYRVLWFGLAKKQGCRKVLEKKVFVDAVTCRNII